MATIWDTLFPKQDYRTAAPSGGYADLYANGLLGNRTDTPTSVGAMETGKDFIPVLSDVLAFGEAGHALSEGDRKTAAILAAGGLLGTIPGLGPTLARPVMAAGRKAAERLNQVGPVPTMYSNPLMGGGTSDPTQTGWTFKDVDRSLNTTKSENRRIAGDTSRIEEVPINQLYATQPSVNSDFATTSSSAGEAPLVVRKNKKMFVQDGHHRLTKAAEAGSQTAKVRFIDLDNVDNSTPLFDWSKEKTQFVEADQDLLDELFAPSPAEEIAGLLSSGRADDVTDEMLGKLTAQDNSELFDLYQSGATGMDLPMDEASRMARADDRNMIDGFHGTMPSGFGNTNNPDIKEFDINRSTRGQSGKGIYFAPPENYDLANSFAGGRKLSNAELKSLDPNSPKIKGVVYPVKVRANNQADYQQMREAQYAYEKQQIAQGKSAGYAGLSDSVPNTLKPQGFSGVSQNHEFTTFFPENVRSKFARFDPRLSNLKNLSAGVGVAPLGLLALREEQKRANEEQYKRGLLQ